MVLELIKLLIETSFYEKKKEIKIRTLHQLKVHIKMKERVFPIKKQLVLKIIFLQHLRNLHDIIRNENNDLSGLQKTR